MRCPQVLKAAATFLRKIRKLERSRLDYLPYEGYLCKQKNSD